jgi:hypothetical protein
MKSSLTVLVWIAAAASAQAQSPDDPARVVVSGSRPTEVTRYDVEKACPGIALALDDSLSQAVSTYGKTGDVRVEFQMSEQRIQSVSPKGGPREYRPAIKRAVRALSCQQTAGDERFVFILRFVDPDQVPQGRSPRRTALLTLR